MPTMRPRCHPRCWRRSPRRRRCRGAGRARPGVRRTGRPHPSGMRAETRRARRATGCSQSDPPRGGRWGGRSRAARPPTRRPRPPRSNPGRRAGRRFALRVPRGRGCRPRGPRARARVRCPRRTGTIRARAPPCARRALRRRGSRRRRRPRRPGREASSCRVRAAGPAPDASARGRARWPPGR